MIPMLMLFLFQKKEEVDIIYFKDSPMVRVKRESKNTIEEVPLENYVVGVLSGEMPTTFPMEALKAQAVAARTYVLKKMENTKEQEYDVVDTVMNQVYYNQEELKERWKEDFKEKINRVQTAVLETEGEFLAYQGEVAQVFFFSTSTGYTENCEEVFQESLPYLKSVKSDWEKEISPVYEDSKTFSLEEFYQKLNLDWNDTVTVQVLTTTSTGRMKTLTVNGVEFQASDVTKQLGLRSSYFEIKQEQNTITIHTKGFGHGVGMSQYGAYGMAENGANYQEILKYYFQGIEIQNIE